MGKYIQTKVIQRRNIQFADCGGTVLPIPTEDDSLGIFGAYWAVPVKDNGVFRGYKFQKDPAESYVAGAGPTPDSFPVMKVYDKQAGDTFWVVGTLEELLALIKDGTDVVTTVPVVVPEIDLCVEVGSTTPIDFTLPPLGDDTHYKVSLYVDNVKKMDRVDDGTFVSAATIRTYLVANWAAVGTWTAVGADVIHLVVSADKSVGLVAEPYTP